MNKSLVSWLIIAVAIIAGIVVYPDMPDQMPIHWNVNNEIDNYADKTFALFLMPGLMVLMMVLNQLKPKMDPNKNNISKLKSSLYIIQNTLLLGLLVIHGFSIALGYGITINIGNIVTPIIGVLFVAIGNYMPRFKQNYFVGIKTPSTLNSETVWRKTHQTSAKFYVIGGLLMIGTVFVPAPLQAILFISIIIIVALSSFFLASYYAKKVK